MKTLTLLPVLATLALSSFAHAGGEGWLTDYAKAVKLSKSSGKPILVDFTGSDWCGWCIKLDNEVFSKPAFKAWAKKNVVLLYLDFPQTKKLPEALKKQNNMLGQKYKIEGFPTILFLDHKGSVLGKHGYQEGGPGKWTKTAEGMIAAGKSKAGSK